MATDAKLNSSDKKLTAAVRDTGTHTLRLKGIGPSTAARILADVGGAAWVPHRHPFAS